MSRPRTLSGTYLPDDAADELAAEGMRLLTDNGVRIRRGWDRGAPFAGEISVDRGLDHLYRLIHPEAGVTCVSEPYQLYPEAVARFAALEGWNVQIDGRALWYPGATVRILFWREGEEQSAK
jgi:hypothetical protein